MFRRGAGAAALALLAATITPQPALAADEPDLPRILLLGDSIMQGKAGDVTWRYHLWNAFDGDLDFVGPLRGQPDEGGAQVEDRYPHAFDFDHASRWGASLTFPDWPLASLIETYDPDVIVEQLGANDFLYDVQTPQSMVGGLRDFVAAARAAKPGIDIVLSQITWNWMPDGQEFNPLLPPLAAELDTPESRVVVSVMPQMTGAEDTYDGSHPNAQAEVKIAAAHEAALRSIGIAEIPDPVVVPTPPPPPPTVLAPAAPRKVKVVRETTARVKVSWRRSAGAEHYVVKCGTATKTTTRLTVKLRSSRVACKVRAVNAAGKSPWAKSS